MAIENHEATFISNNDEPSEHFEQLSGLTKQEYDIVFAAEVVRRGFLTEHDLKKTVHEWTIHGEESLGAFLVRVGALTEENRRELIDQVHHSIQQGSRNTGPRDTRLSSQGSSIVDVIDGSGRLGRLLGFHHDQVANDGSDQRMVKGRYRLVRKLGQGGLGTVWLAHDEMLSRLVAIKEVRTGIHQSPGAVRRFQREAELTGRLEHPSIVPIYQFGIDEKHEQEFYVMRFLGKQNLQDLINEYHERIESGNESKMLLQRLLNAFTSICQAIAYAHSRKVIHRDLKPENVALDSYGQVIVLDWGLAKLIGDEGLIDSIETHADERESAHGTVAGQILGTPMFMAPEQATGRQDEIDERTDIYGLGAILFCILTGTAPHRTERNSTTAGNSSIATILSTIVSRPTPRAREHRSSIPAPLDAICYKAMSKKRYARYQTASELADDVQRYLAGEETTAYRETNWQRIQRWISAHQRFSQIAATLLITLLVVGVNSAIDASRSAEHERETRFEALKGEARQLGDNLQNPALSLARNTRFMASIPPVQTLIDFRVKRSDDEKDAVERIHTIFSGLMGANTEYLTIWLGSLDRNTKQFTEVIRLERTRHEIGSVRNVPTSRLRLYPINPELQTILSLQSGDVYLTTDPVLRVKDSGEPAHRPGDPLELTAAIPIFDQVTGELYGALGIEMDFRQVFRKIAANNMKVTESVLLTSDDGTIMDSYPPGHLISSQDVGQSVSSLIPIDKSASQQFDYRRISTDEKTYYFQPVPLDDMNNRASVGLFLFSDR